MTNQKNDLEIERVEIPELLMIGLHGVLDTGAPLFAREIRRAITLRPGSVRSDPSLCGGAWGEAYIPKAIVLERYEFANVGTSERLAADILVPVE